MVLPIVFLVLLFAVAVIQSGHGFFGALIMAVLTVCCAAGAFGAHEWVANQIVSYWKPDFAHAIALGGTFGIPLLILRIVFDKVIRRDCVVPAMVARVGGGLCGMITAFTMTGTAAVCVQMLPFGESIFGFSRFDITERGTQGASPPSLDDGEHGLWLSPDRFAAAVATVLADGVMSGDVSFGDTYPDFVQTLGWVGTVPKQISRFSNPRGISIVGTEEVQFVYRVTPGNEQENRPDAYEAMPPDVGERFRMVRVQLKNEARDTRKSHLFMLRQFRLVGRLSSDGPTRQYYPVAIQQLWADPSMNRHLRFIKTKRGDWPVVNERYSPRLDNSEQVEVVFELPVGFVPSFLEYKRGARAAVRFDDKPAQPGPGFSERAAAPSAPASPPPTGTVSVPGASPAASSDRATNGIRRRRRADNGGNRGGRVRRFATLDGASTFGDVLPMELKSYRGVRNLEASGGVLRSGHLLAETARQAAGTDAPLTKFDVPSDKRLLHLNVAALKAKSYLGKALSSAVAAAQNYTVRDARGRTHKFIGKYVLATKNGTETLEIQFFPDQVGTIGGLGAFSRVKENNLQASDQLVLLFLVDPGAEIVSFSTGDESRAEDLRAQTLVAPQ